MAPYATALAAMIDPVVSTANLRRLAAAGLEGEYGFFDAIDYTDRGPDNLSSEDRPLPARGVVVPKKRNRLGADYDTTWARTPVAAAARAVITEVPLRLMVRGIALGQVGSHNLGVLLWKEVRVALLNGVALGAVLGAVVLAWFGNPLLSVVIAVAMTLNMLFAATAGVLVPLGLKRAGFDPALASSIFLTTVTDVMGFFTFLGLATLLLLG